MLLLNSLYRLKLIPDYNHPTQPTPYPAWTFPLFFALYHSFFLIVGIIIIQNYSNSNGMISSSMAPAVGTAFHAAVFQPPDSFVPWGSSNITIIIYCGADTGKIPVNTVVFLFLST